MLPPSIQAAGTIGGVVGLLINIYLLIQVKRLSKAKEDEREFMKRVLDIEKLDYILSLTRDNIKDGNSNKPPEELLSEISATRGQLRGALRALEETYEEEMGVDYGEYRVDYFDYYSRGFLNETLSAATETIRIICFRNQRLSSVDVLEVICERANAGVTVELFSVSPELPNDVLGHIGSELRYSTDDVEQLRDEIETYTRTVIDHAANELTARGRQNFTYHLYEELPKMHLVQTDDVLYVSVPHYTPGVADLGSKELAPSLRVPVSSPVGEYIIGNIEYLSDEKCGPASECLDTTVDLEVST